MTDFEYLEPDPLSAPIPLFDDSEDARQQATTGDIEYFDGLKWNRISDDGDDKIMGMSGGVPAWVDPSETDISLPNGSEGDILYYGEEGWDNMTGTRGSVLVGDGDDKWAKLAVGAADTVLTADGTDVSWGEGLPSGVSGDVLYHNGTNWVVLNAGITGDVLTMEGGTGLPIWDEAPSGLPSSSGKSQYMVLQLDGSLNAEWNWVKAHG